MYERQHYFSCEENCGVFLTLHELQKPLPSDSSYSELLYQVGADFRKLEGKISATVHNSEERQRQELAHLASRVEGLEEEQREQDRTSQEECDEEKEQLREQLKRSQQLVARQAEDMQSMRQVAEGCRHWVEEEQVYRQGLTSRIENAAALLRGECMELWEVPRTAVQVSQTILGTGGWGYVAKGTFRGQEVAVKFLHQGILSPQNKWRVRREISIMSQLRHPNLLLLIGAVLNSEEEGPLIITELLDTSLRSAYAKNSLGEESKMPVLRDVASALTYLHSHPHSPIIHRDVSSSNVLLEAIRCGRQWKAKLSDFGSANLCHLATTPAEGAAVYAAPEVSTEHRSKQTAKIDVYSFGVLICEVCLCLFPPERQRFPEMLSNVRLKYPKMFDLSLNCTSNTPQERPEMEEVLQILDLPPETDQTDNPL